MPLVQFLPITNIFWVAPIIFLWTYFVTRDDIVHTGTKVGAFSFIMLVLTSCMYLFNVGCSLTDAYANGSPGQSIFWTIIMLIDLSFICLGIYFNSKIELQQAVKKEEEKVKARG